MKITLKAPLLGTPDPELSPIGLLIMFMTRCASAISAGTASATPNSTKLCSCTAYSLCTATDAREPHGLCEVSELPCAKHSRNTRETPVHPCGRLVAGRDIHDSLTSIQHPPRLYRVRNLLAPVISLPYAHGGLESSAVLSKAPASDSCHPHQNHTCRGRPPPHTHTHLRHTRV